MKKNIGLILAGGKGTRLFPLTKTVNKHLLPVFDKPMIFYPLTMLMLSGIKEIVITSSPDQIQHYVDLFGDGKDWGLNINYAEQSKPNGIVGGLLAASKFINNRNVMVILGDNIFHGTGLPQLFRQSLSKNNGATVFGYPVNNPKEFGVAKLDDEENIIEIIEKPEIPPSNLAIPGIYIYNDKLLEMASQVEPSSRGELEISSLNDLYLKKEQLKFVKIGRGVAWLDGGTPETLFEAGQYVQIIEKRTGWKIACPEEVAYREGFIGAAKMRQLLKQMPNNEYRLYLEQAFSNL